jgi:hypothetical protein
LRKPFLSIILASSLSLGGCASLTQGSLTHKVTIAQHNFLQVVNGFEDAEIANFNQGLIPADIHLIIQGIIQKVAVAGKDLDQSVVSGANAATLQAKIAVIANLLAQLQADGLTGIKNATVKATLELALSQIQAVLDQTLIQAS